MEGSHGSKSSRMKMHNKHIFLGSASIAHEFTTATVGKNWIEISVLLRKKVL